MILSFDSIFLFSILNFFLCFLDFFSSNFQSHSLTNRCQPFVGDSAIQKTTRNGQCLPSASMSRRCPFPALLFESSRSVGGLTCAAYLEAECNEKKSCDECVQQNSLTKGGRCLWCQASKKCAFLPQDEKEWQSLLEPCGEKVTWKGPLGRMNWQSSCCQLKKNCTSCLADVPMVAGNNLDDWALQISNNSAGRFRSQCIFCSTSQSCVSRTWANSNFNRDNNENDSNNDSSSSFNSILPGSEPVCPIAFSNVEVRGIACSVEQELDLQTMVLAAMGGGLGLSLCLGCVVAASCWRRHDYDADDTPATSLLAMLVILHLVTVFDQITDWLFAFSIRSAIFENPYSPLLGETIQTVSLMMLVMDGVSSVVVIVATWLLVVTVIGKAPGALRWYKRSSLLLFLLEDCVELVFQCVVARSLGIRGVFEILAVVLTFVSSFKGLIDTSLELRVQDGDEKKCGLLSAFVYLFLGLPVVGGTIYLFSQIGLGNRGECGYIELRVEHAVGVFRPEFECQFAMSSGVDDDSFYRCQETGQDRDFLFSETDLPELFGGPQGAWSELTFVSNVTSFVQFNIDHVVKSYRSFSDVADNFVLAVAVLSADDFAPDTTTWGVLTNSDSSHRQVNGSVVTQIQLGKGTGDAFGWPRDPLPAQASLLSGELTIAIRLGLAETGAGVTATVAPDIKMNVLSADILESADLNWTQTDEWKRRWIQLDPFFEYILERGSAPGAQLNFSVRSLKDAELPSTDSVPSTGSYAGELQFGDGDDQLKFGQWVQIPGWQVDLDPFWEFPDADNASSPVPPIRESRLRAFQKIEWSLCPDWKAAGGGSGAAATSNLDLENIIAVAMAGIPIFLSIVAVCYWIISSCVQKKRAESSSFAPGTALTSISSFSLPESPR